MINPLPRLNQSIIIVDSTSINPIDITIVFIIFRGLICYQFPFLFGRTFFNDIIFADIAREKRYDFFPFVRFLFGYGKHAFGFWVGAIRFGILFLFFAVVVIVFALR